MDTEVTIDADTQINFKVDARTIAMIEALKDHFRASSRAEVMRKALALLELAREAESENREMAVVDHEDKIRRILLR